MTLPWIQVQTDLPGHRKIGKLRDALGLKERYEALGLLICLWSWAAVHAPSGELEDISDQDLADAAGWRKSPKKFRETLIASGLVDEKDGCLTLHDWDEHQGMFQDALSRARQKNAERQRSYRERRRQEREAQERRRQGQEARAGDGTPPERDEARNVTQSVTGNIIGHENNGPTSSSTRTITFPVSQSAVVDTQVHSGGDGNGGRDILQMFAGEAGQGVVVTPTNEWEAENWNTLRVMGGELGQGVLTLTVWQDRDLLERLGMDGYEHYCKKLVAWVKKSGATVDHYRTILKWWREDTQRAVPTVPMGDCGDGPDIIWGG